MSNPLTLRTLSDSPEGVPAFVDGAGRILGYEDTIANITSTEMVHAGALA